MKKNNYLSLGGLFVALHLLFVFLSSLVAGSEFILVIFLPLLSTIYSLKFNKKEVAMFIVASFLLCLIFEPISTLIYVVPALISGTVYGCIRKKGFKELSLVYISGLSHAVSLLMSFLFISLMFNNIDFFSIFKSFINKDGNSFYLSVYLTLLLLGLLESFLVHIITNSELKKLGYNELESEDYVPFWMNICFIISFILYIVLSIINPIYSCYIFPYLLAFTIPNVVEFISLNKYKWVYFIVAILIIISLFLMNYIDIVLYPILLIFNVLPLVIFNFWNSFIHNFNKVFK